MFGTQLEMIINFIFCIQIGFYPGILATASVGYIAGGNNARIENAPWHAAIMYGDNIFCGGSVINEKWILSAAHCFDNDKRSSMDNLKIIVGSDELKNTNVTSFKPKKIVIHDKFNNPYYSNDIALIELEGAINLKSIVKPIDLINFSEKIVESSCYVYGFGSTVKDQKPSSTLKVGHVPMINSLLCGNLYCVPSFTSGAQPVYKSNICAGNLKGGDDACKGDSGGGLVCTISNNKQVVVGIVSHGDRCTLPNILDLISFITGNPKGGDDTCEGDSGGELVYTNSNNKQVVVGIVLHGDGCGLPNRPTIYTNVSSYLDWISFITQRKIGNLAIPKKYIYNQKLVEKFNDCS